MLRVADLHPNTPAARWAHLRAGLGIYEEALRDLPNQRETGRPLLEEAIKQFDLVLAEAPAEAPEAEMAAMGKARALESRGELDKAIAQYEEVAAKWPNGRAAKEAEERAKLLQTPDAQDFYEKFYAMDFSQVGSTSGGLGTGGPGDLLSIPGLRSGAGSSLFGEPAIPPLGGVPAGATTPPADAPASTPAAPIAEPPTTPELPSDPFAAPAEPKPEPPAAAPE
jgi:hypothetical protein